MRRIVYNISEIEPYINWLYFYHGLGIERQTSRGKGKTEG